MDVSSAGYISHGNIESPSFGEEGMRRNVLIWSCQTLFSSSDTLLWRGIQYPMTYRKQRCWFVTSEWQDLSVSRVFVLCADWNNLTLSVELLNDWLNTWAKCPRNNCLIHLLRELHEIANDISRWYVEMMVTDVLILRVHRIYLNMLSLPTLFPLIQLAWRSNMPLKVMLLYRKWN